MIENILLIACLLFILYFFYTSHKEGFDETERSRDKFSDKYSNNSTDDTNTENTNSTDDTNSTEKSDKEKQLISLLTQFQDKYSDGIQSYVYDHTTKQDNIIIFYGQNNSTSQVSNVDGKLQITVDYGNGNKQTYNYLEVYDTQILFIDSANSKNSAVLQKTDKSMTLTVNSDEKTYTFYPNISDNRNSLASYINEYYYTDKINETPSDSTTQSTQSTQSTQNSQTNRDDLYILKSEIVPPVCPVCPTPITINECSKSGKTGTTGTTGSTGSTGSTDTPQPSSSFVDSLNSAVKNLEGEFTSSKNSNQNSYQNSIQNPFKNSYQNSNQNSNQNPYQNPYQNSNQNGQYQNVNQNSMLLPVQNYFSNAPTLVTNATGSTDEPLPMLNSFSSFG